MDKDKRKGKRKLKNSQGEDVKIRKEQDVWSERHNPSQEAAVDQILTGTRDMNDEYGIMDNVDTVSIADMDKINVIAFYDNEANKMVVNRAFTDIDGIEAAYADCVEKGYHPALGDKSALSAVTAHELGHALADKINEARMAKGGGAEANEQIVRDAFNSMGRKDKSQRALDKARAGISGYATENYHETVAESVADVYCNGKKANKFSQAVVKRLKEVMQAEL
ncbi:MAG: hypothetical protein KBT34_09815 [Prevotella sp.]|nr:hypothetical protein [Candidatus Prevotella equi]